MPSALLFESVMHQCDAPRLPGDDFELATQRQALTQQLMQRCADVAISVWTPLQDPRDPTTPVLLLYNEAYLRLCDATAFGKGGMNDCMPSGAIFRSLLLAHNVAAAIQEGMKLFCAVQAGAATFATADSYHLSKLGRLHRVRIEWYLLRSHKQAGRQVLVAEFMLPETHPQWNVTAAKPPLNQLTSDHMVSQQVIPTTLKARLDLGKKTLRWTNYHALSGERPSFKSIKRQPLSAPGDFACRECGDSASTPRRYKKKCAAQSCSLSNCIH